MSETTRYNTQSQFPTEVDDLLFLNDVDLDHLAISNQHQEYMELGLYTLAGDLLENTTIDSICASLLNAIENRIYATQEHLSNKHTVWYDRYGVESPLEHFDMPSNTTQKPVWANIEDISRLAINSLSSGYTLSTNGGFRP